MDDGTSPDRPTFAAGVPEAKVVSTSHTRLAIGCGAGVALLFGVFVVAVLAFLGSAWFMARQAVSSMAQAGQVVTSMAQAAGTTAAAAPLAGRMFEGLGAAVGEAILLSWGIDRAAENARRLEYVAQSLREYEQRHGLPPASLSELTLLQGDREDVWGVALEYRVSGAPPQWQIRSAGRDRRFDVDDPWLPER